MPTHYQGTDEEKTALDCYIKLQRAAETSLARTTTHLSDYKLTVSQFAILEALYHLGQLSQGELATKLLRSASNISIVLKAIEKRGLIKRQRDPADNRYVLVEITPAGRSLLASFIDQHVAGIVADMSVLTAVEQEELGRLCRKLGLQKRS